MLQRASGGVVNITFLRFAALELSQVKVRAIAPEGPAYRLEDGGALATRIEGAAIFTSTSSIGFLVQA